jgi:hypothetical protein
VTQRLEKLTQSQLDSSGSNYRINIEVWAAPSSRGQRIAIVYKPSDPSVIYLAGIHLRSQLLGRYEWRLSFPPGDVSGAEIAPERG